MNSPVAKVTTNIRLSIMLDILVTILPLADVVVVDVELA